MIVEDYVLNRYSGIEQLASQLFTTRTNSDCIAAIMYMHSWYTWIVNPNLCIPRRGAHYWLLYAWIVECAERIGRGIDRNRSYRGPV